MNLTQLCAAPHVTIYFDSWNNWLYIEWEGELTLAAVQYACLEVAQCYVKHSYPRVLNNDAQITNLPREVAPWLAKHFFPNLKLAGIEQLAWVHAPTVRGLSHATQVLQHLAHLNVGLFADIEQATSWLQLSNPTYQTGCALLPRPLAEETQFAQAVAQFKHALQERGVTAEVAALPA
ncbi:MAG: STAS/SEC14 domain-containing protein [Janthinobacterium lividum]